MRLMGASKVIRSARKDEIGRLLAGRYAQQAEVVKALAHPFRLAVAECLRDGEQCVCEIARCIGAHQSNLSRHLAMMTHAGLLIRQKDGMKVFYRVRSRHIFAALDCVDRILRQQIAEREMLLERR